MAHSPSKDVAMVDLEGSEVMPTPGIKTLDNGAWSVPDAEVFLDGAARTAFDWTKKEMVFCEAELHPKGTCYKPVELSGVRICAAQPYVAKVGMRVTFLGERKVDDDTAHVIGFVADAEGKAAYVDYYPYFDHGGDPVTIEYIHRAPIEEVTTIGPMVVNKPGYKARNLFESLLRTSPVARGDSKLKTLSGLGAFTSSKGPCFEKKTDDMLTNTELQIRKAAKAAAAAEFDSEPKSKDREEAERRIITEEMEALEPYREKLTANCEAYDIARDKRIIVLTPEGISEIEILVR